MDYQEKKFYAKTSVVNFFIIGLLTALFLYPKTVLSYSAEQMEEEYIFEDSDLILETTIQDYLMEDYIYAYAENKIVYLPLSQLGSAIGLEYTKKNDDLILNFTNTADYKYKIDLADFKAKRGSQNVDFIPADYKNIDGAMFFSSDFLSRLLNITINIELYDMTLNIDRDLEFPTLIKLNAEKRRKRKGLYVMQDNSFKDYEMDNRLIGTPVLDVQLGTGVSYNKSNDEYTDSHSYALNFSTIAGGLDIISYISGNSANNDKPTFRLNAGRTFLDEPPNKLNLKKFEMGDINGISDSYFTNVNYGRGVTFSSFKNLVMSANKTIDITGPLTEGWEVELYWNNQLIGFRQTGLAGQYNFSNIPVTYGLNTFELVFYGPYGEIRKEEKRYYSGTSPVKKGEFGYNIAAYQPWKYLIETNETNPYEGKDIAVLDSNFYYGLTDNVTLMAGMTQTPDAKTKDTTQYFSQTGVQYAVKGSSIQYNLERSFDTGKIGHHAEWQGNVYIGNLYASYDEYNGLHSPNSFYGNEYLKNKTEFRFNGTLPWALPYYISYRTGKKENNDVPYEDIVSRISKNFSRGWYLSLENSYDAKNNENELSPMIYKRWGNFSFENVLNYRTNPNPKATNFSSKLTWRDDRYTYWTASYNHDMEYNRDSYSLSGSRIFPFGGLSLSLNYDDKQNFSTYLTYSISFAKEPDGNRILMSNNSQFSNSGTVFVKAQDEHGNPLKGIGFMANNMVDEVYTDEKGTALLTDLMAYEKTILDVDIETISDVSLQPVNPTRKLVLRPGTIKTVDFEFKYFGSIEGYIHNPKGKRMYGYKVSVMDENNKEISSNYTDLEGYFVVSDIPFGKYDVIISKESEQLSEIKDIVIDDVYVYIGEVLR